MLVTVGRQRNRECEKLSLTETRKCLESKQEFEDNKLKGKLNSK